MNSLVSVIIPCYNLAHFLDETIKSVLSQTYPNIEVIVINDGSKDNTIEVVSRYSKVKCITQAQQGVSAARNSGIKEAKGDYLIFLDADDRFLPDAIESSIACLEANPQTDFVVNQCRWVSEKGDAIFTPPQVYLEKDYYFWLLCGVNLANTTGAVTYRYKVFESQLRFDTQFSAVEDCDFYLHLTRQFSGVYQKKVVVEYRKHISSLSSNNLKLFKDTLSVFDKQLEYVSSIEKYSQALKIGKITLYIKYGTQLIFETQEKLKKYAKLLEKYEKLKSLAPTNSQNSLDDLTISKEKQWLYEAQLMNEETLLNGFSALFTLQREELEIINKVFNLYQKNLLKDLTYLANIYQSFINQIPKSRYEEEFLRYNQYLTNTVSMIKTLLSSSNLKL